MQEYILGVKALLPQHEKVQVKPLIFGDKLDFAKGKVPTDRGDIEVSWKVKKKKGQSVDYTLTVDIPDNMQAKVYIPKGDRNDNIVKVDGQKLEGTIDGDYIYFDDIGSGLHEFKRENISLTQESTLAGIDVEAANTIPEGLERQFVAIPYDFDLNDLDIPVKWESDNVDVVTVDENGLVKAVGVGEATLTASATLDEVTKTVFVNVEVVAPQYRFYYDMGNGDVADGYTQVDANTFYTEAKGFGLIGSMDQRDRGTSGSLTSDFVFSKSAYTFRQNVMNGTYRVKVIVGDAIASQSSMTIKAEGEIALQNISTDSANEFVTKTFTATVNDGVLDLEIYGEGDDSTARINALEIVKQ